MGNEGKPAGCHEIDEVPHGSYLRDTARSYVTSISFDFAMIAIFRHAGRINEHELPMRFLCSRRY